MRRLIERAIDNYLLFWAAFVVRVRRPRIVGITGSVGKTTTKEVIAAALQHPEARAVVGDVRKTPGNLNNTRGVPFVVLGYDDWARSRLELVKRLLAAPVRAVAFAFGRRSPQVLVLEFAAGPNGDMRRTTRAAPPTVAVVTAIGPAHLEAFGTVDRIVDEKSSLVRRVPPDGLVVLGAENSHASTLDRLARARVVKVGGRGRALSDNAARAVCAFFGVRADVVERAVASAPAVPGRLHLFEAGRITVIDDAYNANPLSMQLGLDTLAARTQRRVAILGEMLELGGESQRYHAEIAEYARQRADVVVGVGARARHYAPDHWFATSDECARALGGIVTAGDCVLVKGSNAVGLGKVVRSLKRMGAEAAV